MHTLRGGCHCGTVSATFTTEQDPANIAVRECQCTFCRRHGARTFSDPTGQAAITGTAKFMRYRFAAATADFLLCPRCGCFVAAFLDHGGQGYATLNAAGLAMQPMASTLCAPVSYDREDASSRIARRIDRWTPTTLAEPVA